VAQAAEAGGAGVSSVVSIVDDPGPTNGLTLDAAIDRMMSANLDLKAIKYELPQAEADVLTAGLRANPIVYMDTQFIPYGAFSNRLPGGPTQYDINITHPFDLSHKRKSRVAVARAAQCVLEAQYQDLVRREIGNLYRAFVDLQAARLNYLASLAAVRKQERILAAAVQNVDRATTPADTARRSVQLDKARASVDDAADALSDAREAIGLLLNLEPHQVATLEPRGSLRERGASPPPLDVLTRIALAQRADLNAARLGLTRARNDVQLARANRLDDVFLFYDPITYQDNRPFHNVSARSWDVGIAIPLPIYNRNQGNIARAQSNFSQTQTELVAQERRVVSQVRQAHREYISSRDALTRVEQSILPQARAARSQADSEFAATKMSLDEYVDHLGDDADTARFYRDAVVRHRRSVLDLNTAIGVRLRP
jgi:cobalt-zinc-cadmium efflux system outer membrane protein